MESSSARTVRRLLSDSPGEALCDACLAFACGTSLAEMREVTRALALEDAAIQRAATCASCRRTVAAILVAAQVEKCSQCSRPLDEGEAGVAIEGDRFHDACLRRLMTDRTVRLSRALTQRSRELIEQSRRRIREGHGRPPLDGSG